jgi:peptidoglycan lytic transglycosylase
LLRDHLLRFPASTKASAALYFLGRLAEHAKDFATAKAHYSTITDRFPGHYYGLLARDRMSQSALVKATQTPQATQFLSQIAFPSRRTSGSYEATPATARHIERARLLNGAGLTALAEAELRYAAKTDSQPHLIGMEMARSAPVHKGLRYMKSFAPDYLSLPLDAAPQAFWEHLFPLPFRTDLVRSTRATALDPHVVAGLMRQESEFDPKAISVKKAYGLTQVMPSTGRQLARKAGMKKFSSNMLFQPATNLRLGTIYLRSLLDQWGGKWEETLASFNAGKSRVVEWQNWANYQEPAEFVETIPFTETRDYVQAVMRNAAMYRRLYETKLRAKEVTPEPAPPVIRKVSAPVKKRPVRRTRG